MQQYRPNNLPPAVKNLLIINVLVFLGQNIFDTQYNLTYKMGLWPVASPHFRPYQVFTHMFTHANITHIFFNMFALWMFGKILENVWGAKRFLFFYLVCGIGAAIAHQAVQYFQYQEILEIANLYDLQGLPNKATEIRDMPIFVVGASGAVMGVMAAFAFLFPNTELFLMFIPIPIKAKWAVLGYVAIDLFSGVSRISGDNVAHFAHLGGALTGFIIVLIWNKTNRRTLY